jgi:4-hydroxy-2-oxoheptanedioate aldolase
MRNSKVMAKWRSNKPAKVAFMGYFLPNFIAFCADGGYDAVWIDLEHRAFDAREVQTLLAFCQRYDIDAIVRPATREKALLYRYYEDGASGLIIPHVNDAQTTRDLVRSTKLPPMGDRGVEARGLEANYGLDVTNGHEAFLQHAQDNTYLIVMIETYAGIQAVNEIAQVAGLDGIFLGPLDYTLRVPYHPSDNRISLQEAQKKLREACMTHGKAWGWLGRTTEHLKELVLQHASILVWGTDTVMLHQAVKQTSQDLKDVLGE